MSCLMIVRYASLGVGQRSVCAGKLTEFPASLDRLFFCRWFWAGSKHSFPARCVDGPAQVNDDGPLSLVWNFILDLDISNFLPYLFHYVELCNLLIK